MPIFSSGYDPTAGRRLAAWTAHYMAKGCYRAKAQAVAWKKVCRSWTWPPT